MLELNKIYNGDCLELMKSIDDKSVDLIVTDPPYGLLNDKIETDYDYKEFFKEAHRVLKDNSFIVYFGQQPSLSYWNVEALKHFKYKNEVIWYKRHNTAMFSDMRRVFENIMIAVKGKRKFNQIRRPYSDIKESLAEFSEVSTLKRDLAAITEITKDISKQLTVHKSLNGQAEYVVPGIRNVKTNFASEIKEEERYIKSLKSIYNGYLPQNLVSFMPHNLQKLEKDEYNIKHPTVKPIQLIEYLIDLCSNKDDVVLDCFLGSGTTALACLNTNRNYIGIELDKNYYDMSVKRVEDWYKEKEMKLAI